MKVRAVLVCLLLIGIPAMISYQPPASGLVVNSFEGDAAKVTLRLRGPGFKDDTGIEIPSDGMVIDGSISLQGVPWTRSGVIEHMHDEDFQSGTSIEHVEMVNDTVILERISATVEHSQDDEWGNGASTGLVKGDTLELAKDEGMAFLWDNVLSNASNQQENIRLAVDDDGVTHAVWEDNRKGLDIFYARSVDGVVYEGHRPLDSLQDRFVPQQGPDIAIDDDGIIHVVYADGRTTDDDYDIFYTRSTDGGDNFQGEVRVDHGGTDYQFAPAVAVDASGSVHIVWEDNRDGNTTIYYSKDKGTEFRVTNRTDGHQAQPEIAIDQNGWAHVAYRDDSSLNGEWKVYHSRLAPGGTQFQDETRMNPGTIGTDQYSPVLEVAESGRIILAWHDDRAFNFNIYLSTSDNGINFTDPVRVSRMLVTGYSPTMDERDGVLHMAWYDYYDGDANIYYRNSTDGGLSFNDIFKVNNDNSSKKQRSPALAAGVDGFPRVAWVDFRQHSAGDIFTTKGGTNHAPNGTLETWIDLGAAPYDHSTADWAGQIPLGVEIEVCGRTSNDNATWTDYVDMVTEPQNLTPGRHLNLRTNVTTKNRAYTPSITNLWANNTKYASTGSLVSSFQTTDNPVARATVEWDLEDQASEVEMHLTVDGGLSWTRFFNGTEASFEVPGTSLGYMVVLNRSSLGTPVLERVRIDHTEESYPADLELTIGDTSVWTYNGPFSGQAQITEIGDPIDDYIASLNDPDELVTVPVELTGRTIGDVVLSDLELDIARAPLITDHGPRGTPTVVEGEEIVLWVSVHERDGRPLSYIWTVDGETIENMDNSTISYRPPYEEGDIRTDVVMIEVSNGHITIFQTWDLLVEPSNRLPVIETSYPEMGSVLIDKDRPPIVFSVDVFDPDGDTLTYQWVIDGVEVSGAEVDTFTFDPTDETAGEREIAIKVSDGTGSVQQVWNVIILPIEKDSTEEEDPTMMILMTIFLLLVIIACVIIFVETYRKARGNKRVQRKRLLDEEEGLLEAGEELQELKREQRLLSKGKVDPNLKKRVKKRSPKKRKKKGKKKSKMGKKKVKKGRKKRKKV